MKWLAASDIHGSAHACRKLLEAYDREGAERLILLGDLLYHGPRNDLPREYDPKAVIAMLNRRKNNILCVRGNCDSEVDQMVLDFPILADYALFCIGIATVFATHGHRFNVADPPPLQAGDILLQGHTHIPACKPFGQNNLYCNTGSVAIPKENMPPSYLLIQPNRFTWKTLDGEPFQTLSVSEKPAAD